MSRALHCQAQLSVVHLNMHSYPHPPESYHTASVTMCIPILSLARLLTQVDILIRQLSLQALMREGCVGEGSIAVSGRQQQKHQHSLYRPSSSRFLTPQAACQQKVALQECRLVMVGPVVPPSCCHRPPDGPPFLPPSCSGRRFAPSSS